MCTDVSGDRPRAAAAATGSSRRGPWPRRSVRHRGGAPCRTRRWAPSSTTWSSSTSSASARSLCCRAGRRVRPNGSPGGRSALALGLHVIGNLLFTWVPRPGRPFPSLPDIVYLAAYPPMSWTCWRWSRRVPRFRPSMWLDGAIGALGVTACRHDVRSRPVARHGGDRGRAATLTYPVADVLLLALSRRSSPSAACTTTGRCCWSPGVRLQAHRRPPPDPRTAQGGYVVGGPTDLTWVAGGAAHRPRRRAGPLPPRDDVTCPAIRAPASAGGPCAVP